tara:strand:- start:60 stop:194 length:135 start_codon:yes stop_codon:yes gene_type:complete
MDTYTGHIPIILVILKSSKMEKGSQQKKTGRLAIQILKTHSAFI